MSTRANSCCHGQSEPGSVPAVSLPEGLGRLGGAIAVAHVAAEGLELLAAVDGGVVGAQVEDAVAEQELAEAERGRGRVVGGRVAARLAHDDPVLGRGGARQVAAATRAPPDRLLPDRRLLGRSARPPLGRLARARRAWTRSRSATSLATASPAARRARSTSSARSCSAAAWRCTPRRRLCASLPDWAM